MSETLEAVAREVGENPVVIYMKGTPAFPMCGFSAATIEVLNQIGVPYKAIDVLAEGDKREAVKQFTKWPRSPRSSSGASSWVAATSCASCTRAASSSR
jgi:monothiol glutaredoxin